MVDRAIRQSYLFELECDDPAYLWSGHGNLVVGGKTYLGAGELLSLPDLRQLINGVAERIEISVSGVDEDTLRFAQEDRLTIPHSIARIGRVKFDSDWQVEGDIEWLWYGVADSFIIGSSVSENGRVRSIRLSLASADTRRSNPQLSFFTDAEQRKRSPDDAFFSHIGQISAGITREFGPK